MPTFQGNASSETINGTTLNDLIYGNGGNDQLFGDQGADQLYGGTQNDMLAGGEGDDQLFGGADNDVLDGGAGNDFMNGGTGIDWADFSSGGGVNADLLTNTASGQGNDSMAQIENLRGSGFDDILRGNNAVNLLEGGNGNDRFRLSQGADVLFGGAGADLLDLSSSQIGLAINMGDPITGMGTYAGIYGGPYQGTFSDIEDLLATNYSDTIVTDGFQHTINAGLGALDRITASAGIDTLSYAGLQANNVIDLTFAPGAVFSGRTTHSWNGSQIGIDEFVGIENVVGGAFADVIRGDALSNVIDGGDGDDVLRVSGGLDSLIGGLGNDTLSFDSTTGATAGLDVGTYSVGPADHGTVSGFENVTGSAFADTFMGSSTNNVVSGGLGDDWLNGNAGSDQLFGGGGADWLVSDCDGDVLTGDADFNLGAVDSASDRFEINNGTGTVRITDFSVGVDKLDLLSFALNQPPGVQVYYSGTAAIVGNDTVISITGLLGQVSTIILEGVGVCSGFSIDDMIGGNAALVPPGACATNGGDGLATVFVLDPSLGDNQLLVGFEDGLDVIDISALYELSPGGTRWVGDILTAQDGSVAFFGYEYSQPGWILTGNTFSAVLTGMPMSNFTSADYVL